MKSRILSIALALSLLAAIFVALPAKSAIDYTGSVRTTDDDGIAKSTFIQGEDVYVFVTLVYHGDPYNASMAIVLENLAGTDLDTINVNAAQFTALGEYNSSDAGTHLSSGWGLGALEEGVYNVVVIAGGERLAQTYIVVKGPGIKLEPPQHNFVGDHKTVTAYAPGQALTLTVQLDSVEAMSQFYVHVVNSTYVALTGLNWTGQNSPSGWWSKSFTLPANTPDGTLYRVQVRQASNDAVWYSMSFTVRKYVFEVIEHRDNFVPGMTALIDYYVINMGTLQPDTGVTITYSAHWLDASGNDDWMNSTLTGTTGTQSFVIPTDISLYENIDITYWANQSGRSDTDSVTLYLSRLAVTVTTGTGYSPGDTVVVNLGVNIGGEGIEGALVDVKVSHNGTAVTTYAANDLVTDIYGVVAYAFVLDATAAIGSYIVVATGTWLTQTANGEARFTVSSTGSLVANFDKEAYFSGETATVNLKAVWSQEEVQLPVVAYRVTLNGAVPLAIGNTTTMEITVDIPDDYYGGIYVRAAGLYNGNELQDTDSATVEYARISLATSATAYRPGDVIEFSWLLVAPVETGNLTYEIVDGDDVRVASDALTPFEKTGSFELTIPELSPADEYTATIFAGLRGVVRSASVTVGIVADDYELMVWVAKSPYADGGYRPGQTAKIHYSIGSYMLSQQTAYRITVSVSGDPIGLSVLVTEPTGDIEYKIPKQTAVSYLDVEADLYELDGTWLDGDGTSFMVSNAESGWDRSIGGMAAIDFVLLVLLIIVIVMLILVPWLKGRMGAPKPQEPAPPAESGKLPPP